MCEAKPGTRCAADTRPTATETLLRYEQVHPDGPSVEPLSSAREAMTTEVVNLHDAHGNIVTVTPGIVDRNAEYVYSNGQCLAFALALADKDASIEVALAAPQWENGHEPTELTEANVRYFVHAVTSWGDDLYDVKGEHEREGFVEALADSHGAAVLLKVTPEQVHLLLNHVPPQDVATARTMVDAMWDFDDEGTAGDAGPVEYHPDYQPAEPCPPGYVDLYHRTSSESAQRIATTGQMLTRENTHDSYFSTHVDGQTDGYGDTVVWVRVPEGHVTLDDEFPNGEQHYRVPNRVVGTYLMHRCDSCGLWAGADHEC